MKRIGWFFLTVCLLFGMGLTAGAVPALPGEPLSIEVLAQIEETFDEDTRVAEEKDGAFTVETRDGATLTVSVQPGALPEGARLMAIAVPEGGEAYRWFSSVVGKARLSAYALYFVRDGKRLPFEGDLELSVTAPEGMAAPVLYTVSTDGRTRTPAFEAEDGRILLTTGYEAPYYVLADKNAGPGDVPRTGDAGFTGWALAAMASLLLLAIVRKRWKKEGARWS